MKKHDIFLKELDKLISKWESFMYLEGIYDLSIKRRLVLKLEESEMFLNEGKDKRKKVRLFFYNEGYSLVNSQGIYWIFIVRTFRSIWDKNFKAATAVMKEDTSPQIRREMKKLFKIKDLHNFFSKGYHPMLNAYKAIAKDINMDARIEALCNISDLYVLSLRKKAKNNIKQKELFKSLN